jgi:hypothetical protein
METLLDVNDEELRHLGRYSNPGTINDKTGETVTARMERIRQAMPRYRSEYEQLRGRTPESGADTPGIPVRQLLEQLSAGSGIEPKLLEDYAKTATEVYGETALRKVVARVALVNKMSPAVCEAAALPFRPPVDVRQLVTQLGRGVLPVRPSPEQTVTVTNAYLLTAPEDSVRLRYESVLDRISVPQKQIAEYQRFIENETKGLANETREDANEEVVKRLTQNIRKTRENIAVEQQKITAMQQVLFHFEAALAVFEATSLKFEGKQQESDRVYLKLREKYGPDLARMDADLEKRVVEAIDGLRKRNQLTPYELAVVEGRQQDAVRLAVDRQQNQTPDSDLLAQARGPRRQVNIDTLRNPRRILPADEPPITEFGGKRIAGLRRERGGKILIDDEAINGGNKYRKQCTEFLHSQNGVNGCTIREPNNNNFFNTFTVSTATIEGTFSTMLDGEWVFSQTKPAPERSGPVNANWFTNEANTTPQDRAAINALHKGLLDRSDPEVIRRVEARANSPELGFPTFGRLPSRFEAFERRTSIDASFTVEPYESYMGRYEGNSVEVQLNTGGVAGMRGQPLFRIGVESKQHLVGISEQFIAKLQGTPRDMTAVLRREPRRPEFGQVYPLPRTDFRQPQRYEQQVRNVDILQPADLVFVRVDRSVEEMRETERRGLAVLARHNPERISQRRWDAGADNLLDMDTTVQVRKGSIVLEYLFSSTEGKWLCREIEREGKKFDAMQGRDVLSAENRGFHPVSVRYSESSDDRRQFNALNGELTSVEGGMAGRSALLVFGEEGPQNPERVVAGVGLRNIRNTRYAQVDEIEKRNVEESRDVVRAIDSDPALRSVVGEAGKVQSSMALMQRLFDAGKDGTRRQSLVDLMRNEAQSVLGILNSQEMQTNINRSKARLQELRRVTTGVNKAAIDKEIDDRIKALTDLEATLTDPRLRQFCEHIVDKSEYDVSTFWTWLERNIATIVAIVVATLAVVLAVFTFGVTSPLAVAAISAAAGVVASEVTSEVRFQLHHAYDEEVTSGRATFRNRSTIGAFTRAVVKDEKVYNPETGKMEHADVLTHLIDPLGKQFVEGFVTTLALMGAGAVIGKGLTALANTNCMQALISNSPRLTRIVTYLAKTEQAAAQTQKNMKGFMSTWGRETAEEFRDEFAERIAGDWASAAFIARRNFRPKNFTNPRTLATSDASPRFMGEFEYETNGNPKAAIDQIVQWATMEGAQVSVAADGKIAIALDGRTFLLSPDAAVTDIAPSGEPTLFSQAAETTPALRDQGVKLAAAAKADPAKIGELKEFLIQHDVNDATRVQIAEALIGRTLNDVERKALIDAHNSPGTIDNLTGAQVFAKARILLSAFGRTNAQVLLYAGVCGRGDAFDARRIVPGQEYTIRTPSGKLKVATFVRVQGGKYVFLLNENGVRAEASLSLHEIVGNKDYAAAQDEGNKFVNEYLQRGGNVTLALPNARGRYVFVRESGSRPDSFVMRNVATGVETYVSKSSVYDAVHAEVGYDEVRPPAPGNVLPELTVLTELERGLKVKIDGREYVFVGEPTKGRFAMEDTKSGLIKAFTQAEVVAAARVALAARNNPSPSPDAITDDAAAKRIIAGLPIQIRGETYVYVRPSRNEPTTYVMKRKSDGEQCRVPIDEAIAAAKVAMQADANPAVEPKPDAAPKKLSKQERRAEQDVVMGREVRIGDAVYTFDGDIDANGDLLMKNVRTGETVRFTREQVIAGRLLFKEQPTTPEKPLTEADLRVGTIYLVSRSSGKVERWKYVGGQIGGAPKFTSVDTNEDPSGFPLQKVRRIPAEDALPLAEALPEHSDFVADKTYRMRRSGGAVEEWTYVCPAEDGRGGRPRARFKRTIDGSVEYRNFHLDVAELDANGRVKPVEVSLGAVDINGIEVKVGETLIVRPHVDGTHQELKLDVISPEHPNIVIVKDAAGESYRIDLQLVREWQRNTGLKPGQRLDVPPAQTMAQDATGKTVMVMTMGPDGMVTVQYDLDSPRLKSGRVPYKDLKNILWPLDEQSAYIDRGYIGPVLRRVPQNGDPILLLTDKTPTSPARLEQGWVVRRTASGRLEAYNSTTRRVLPYDAEHMFHPLDLRERIPAISEAPEATFFRKKLELLEGGKLPLSKGTFQHLFPPDSDFSQRNVGNCYLIASLHSLRQSPHFEILVRSAVKPIIEELDVPDPNNRGRTIRQKFTVAYDVRIPLGGGPNSRVVRVEDRDIGYAQHTVAHAYFGLDGPIGFQVLEAAYTLSVHGRDGSGQINRKASSGGLGHLAIQQLLGSSSGEAGHIVSDPSCSHSISRGEVRTKQEALNFLNSFSVEKHFATANTPRRGSDQIVFFVKDIQGNDVGIHCTHAYSIESVNTAAKTVTVVNPHDTSKPITLQYNVFLETFSDISYVTVDIRNLLQ